jgi:quinol monooxygenase YgiN
MTDTVKVMAVLTARPGKAGALRILLDNLVAPSRSEPGNLHYDLWTDQAMPGRFVLDELYADATAAAAHHASAHFQVYLSKIEDLAERAVFNLEAVAVG